VANKIEQIITADASGFVRGVGLAEKSLGGLDSSLKSFQQTAATALSLAGIGIGVTEIIGLADAYGQMTGKLKLATQYSGDFAQVMQMLRDSSRETRADLPATVQLYSQLSPALKGIGLSAKESVGIITTINQAIVLSGASSQAAEAALVQLGQGFASGALRGEELNSIMEQTPALAQAIADGLGVSRGALRQMGADGKLTGEVVAQALQKVAAQVNDDFAKMPVTVGQAFTNLRNEFLVFVGVTDQASGGTSALADGINAVAREFSEAGPAVTAVSTALKTMMNGLDGSYRLLKILGTGLAAYAAMAKAAFSGNFSEAKAIWADLGNEIDAVLQKPLIGQERAVSATTDSTRKRLQLETQLADEMRKLEQLKAYESGKALDNIAAKDKANIDARIADQQRLVDAVRKAWQESLADAEKYANSAKEKLQKATDFRQSGESAAFNASLKGVPEEQQAALKAQRLNDVQAAASFEATRARMAAIEGDVKKFDTLSQAAESRLKDALQLAKEIGDVESIRGISEQLAGLSESGASLDAKRSAAAKATAESQAATLNALQAQLTDMQAKARSMEVQVDVAKAESAIKGLQAQLAEIKDKTVTVTVNTVSAGAGGAAATPPAAPGFAGGGWTGPGGKYQVAGLVHAGEFVHRQEVVRQPGAMAFLSLFNRIGMEALKGYANGGLVMRMPGLAAASHTPPAASHTPLVLDFGKLGRFQASAREDAADNLVRVFKRAALGLGKR